MRRWLVGLVLCLGAVPAWADFPLARGSAIYMIGTNTTTHLIPNPVSTKVGDLVLVHAAFDGGATAFTWPTPTYLVGNAWSVCQAWTADADAAHSSEIRYGVLDEVMAGTGAGQTLTTANEAGTMIVVAIAVGTFTGNPVCNNSATSTAAGVPSTVIDPPNLTSGFGAVDTGWIVTASVDGATTLRLAIPITVPEYATTVIANLFDADSTGNAMTLRNLNAASLDPPTNILVAAPAEQSLTNVIAIQGATPTTGSAAAVPRIFH